MSIIALSFAFACLCWCCFIATVQFIGITRLLRNYSRPSPPPVSPSLPVHQVPHLTIIRPVKGLDTELYQCLVSACRQAYPREKLSIYFCVDSKSDPAVPVLQRILSEFPKLDARIFYESEDPVLHGPDGHIKKLGPNPKVRNLSRAYREAKGDIVWVIDANIWVGPNVGGRMVDKLCGYLPEGYRATPYKFVHQIPIVVDTVPPRSTPSRQQPEDEHLLPGRTTAAEYVIDNDHERPKPLISHIKRYGGGRLEEMFMATTHAKFYSAINAVGIAPCVVGKSNMWRRSHLQQLTDHMNNPKITACPIGLTGVDYFSRYICEDHMIGDLLFRCPIPGFKSHGLVAGDIAVQPVANMSVRAYIGRRVRWLRARKWTVVAATLVEPGVESLLCNFYFGFALTTIPRINQLTGIPQTWTALWIIWCLGVLWWMMLDWFVVSRLHSGQSTEVSPETPSFAQGTTRPCGVRKRPFREWLAAWMGRELLALPVWTWAVLLGATVNWRGSRFIVRADMSVVELDADGKALPMEGQRHDVDGGSPGDIPRITTPEVEGGLFRARSKGRVE